MKLLISLLLVLYSITSFGQIQRHDNLPDYEKDSYVASNGVTYKAGDTIIMGRGSAPNGDFRYLNIGGWGAALSYNSNRKSDQTNIGRSYSGYGVVLKRIAHRKFKGIEKIVFIVGGGNITNYELEIEDAIATCEVKDCNRQNGAQALSVPDEIRKYKKLEEDGIITQEEFEKQKNKLLNK